MLSRDLWKENWVEEQDTLNLQEILSLLSKKY